MHVRALVAVAVVLAAPVPAVAAPPFSIKSPMVRPNLEMSELLTCDGKGASPPLSWSAPPDGTKSLVLLVNDQDAARKPFVHWVVYNIPPVDRRSDMGLPPPGARVGLNSHKKARWLGPCPPKGLHHYAFTLYALDTTLSLSNPTEAEVQRAMRGHVLASARMMGTYERPQGQQ